MFSPGRWSTEPTSSGEQPPQFRHLSTYFAASRPLIGYPCPCLCPRPCPRRRYPLSLEGLAGGVRWLKEHDQEARSQPRGHRPADTCPWDSPQHWPALPPAATAPKPILCTWPFLRRRARWASL